MATTSRSSLIAKLFETYPVWHPHKMHKIHKTHKMHKIHKTHKDVRPAQ